jgi:hypothetical protein
MEEMPKQAAEAAHDALSSLELGMTNLVNS